MNRILSLLAALVLTPSAFASIPPGFKTTKDAIRQLKVVEINLKRISPLPIFGGYGNVNSDQNHENFVEPICRALGFTSAEESTMGWTHEDRTPQVTVFTTDSQGRSYSYVMNLKSNENISILRRLSCSNR